jgi:uncharacterized damage-inducible protein DinB
MTAERTDVPAAWDDRTQLTTMLDYARATVRAKCAGLTDELARQGPLPTSPLISISGLVNHLRWVERGWFEVGFLGQPRQSPSTPNDPDREMRIAATVPLSELLTEYDSACARSREIAAAHDLDAPSRRNLDGRPFTLRYAMLHLIEETARHNGHIDILRELADGVTGV